jgi:hypothetical protein
MTKVIEMLFLIEIIKIINNKILIISLTASNKLKKEKIKKIKFIRCKINLIINILKTKIDSPRPRKFKTLNF